jgi:hypothetical protein
MLQIAPHRAAGAHDQLARLRDADEDALRDAAGDPESHWYYMQCLVGWRAWLKRLQAPLVVQRFILDEFPIVP